MFIAPTRHQSQGGRFGATWIFQSAVSSHVTIEVRSIAETADGEHKHHQSAKVRFLADSRQ